MTESPRSFPSRQWDLAAPLERARSPLPPSTQSAILDTFRVSAEPATPPSPASPPSTPIPSTTVPATTAPEQSVTVEEVPVAAQPEQPAPVEAQDDDIEA